MLDQQDTALTLVLNSPPPSLTSSACNATSAAFFTCLKTRKLMGIIRNCLASSILNQKSYRHVIPHQLYCLVCAPESASLAAMLSRAFCFSVSDCVCERCASSCLPSLPLAPPCDALARSWEGEEHGQLSVLFLKVLSTEPIVWKWCSTVVPSCERSHPSSRNHASRRMLSLRHVAVTIGLSGISVCSTHLGSFCGGVSG